MTKAKFCVSCGSGLTAPETPYLKPQCADCGWFPATDALPVALVLAHTPSGRILYTRQRGWPEHAWGLVAGYVEAGETAEAAALREVREETGLVADAPRLMKTLSSGDLLLLVIKADVPDAEPQVGAELEAVALREPDLTLTPHEWWPARQVIAEFIESRAGGSRPG